MGGEAASSENAALHLAWHSDGLFHSHRKTKLQGKKKKKSTTPRKEAGSGDRLERHLSHLAAQPYECQTAQSPRSCQCLGGLLEPREIGIQH